MSRALATVPRDKLFFGAQPQSVRFFERLGCEPGPAGMVLRRLIGAVSFSTKRDVP